MRREKRSEIIDLFFVVFWQLSKIVVSCGQQGSGKHFLALVENLTYEENVFAIKNRTLFFLRERCVLPSPRPEIPHGAPN